MLPGRNERRKAHVMVTRFYFPKPSANVENATLTAWLKQVGDALIAGEIVAEITTDKGVIEVEAPVDGTLLSILAEEGSMFPVGYIMALIGDPGDELPDVTRENERTLSTVTEQAGENRPARPPEGRGREARKRTRVRATPAARRLARDNALDLADVAKQNAEARVDEQMVKTFLEKRA